MFATNFVSFFVVKLNVSFTVLGCRRGFSFEKLRQAFFGC